MNPNDELPELTALSGERGIPSVNERARSTKARALVFIVLLVFVAIAAGGLLWSEKKKAEKNAAAAAEEAKRSLVSTVPAKTFTEPAAKEVPLLPGPAADQTQTPEQKNTQPPLPGGDSEQSPGGKTGNHKVYIIDKSASDVMITTVKTPSTAAPALGGGDQPGSGEDDPRGGMATMLASTKTATRKASFLPNRNFLLAKGAFIDCGLQTRLDSTVPGMTACVVSRDVYSDNGKVLLIERGSTVTGEYQSTMRQGMARIFVLWNRIKTPNGVVVPLDSPGTDQLGGSGIPGYVDNHFWQRFGGALMLSLVDDVARGVTTKGGNSDGNQFNFSSTGDATQNMAAEALRNTINIPPTLYRNQGGQVGIFVARDLDFSGVYDVSPE
ncbi:type IV secretion system protein VirB10 [Pseudomonas sp. LPH60]|uniref:type IV secretion system protein VirB10 n=1 Tax=Pseudomonas sp. LPH60 TaxID=3065906 RepID=UPI00273B31CA|nr:type IV secretion system protein VirB10 [Pseudomonas sp. LPH60]MDP4573444.1 type IV secretion system protein VirB10 [Pseudomonas sp. LPH60]